MGRQATVSVIPEKLRGTFVSRLEGAFAFVVTTLLATLGCSSQPVPPSNTNVVLITMDTTRADFLGVYGFAQPVSPNIDRLAARGTVFDAAYSTAPLTAPAHASILTSQHPSVHGILFNGHRVRAKIGRSSVTLAEHLSMNGWRTGAVVSAAVLGERYNFNRGFSYFERVLGSQEVEDGDRAIPVTDRAIKWLRRDTPAPFFLWVHYFDPHLPYEVTEETQQAFDIQDRKIRKREAAGISTDRIRQIYRGEIFETDAAIGRLLSHIERSSGDEDTLVILTADHGEYLHEHGGMIGHSRLFEQVLRVPLIMAGPGVPQMERRASMVSVIDIAPTILEALGVSPLPHAQGTSYWGFPSETTDRPVFAEWRDYNLVLHPDRVKDETDFQISVQVGATKLILPILSMKNAAVYDLLQDPTESENLIHSNEPLASRLRSLLDLHVQKDLPDGLKLAEQVELADSDKQMLRALGYIE